MINIKLKEEWKNVVYLDVKRDMYSVSNYGNIMNIKTNKKLHPWKAVNGYLYATLMTEKNSVKSIGMHVLVAEHFCKKPIELLKMHEKIVPNHNDFNKENNYCENLTWMTYAMNNNWNYIHGHYVCGENSPNAKSTNLFVEKICELMSLGYLNKEIFEILGIERTKYTVSLLSRIRNGSQWKQISSKYNISNKNTLRKYNDEFINKLCSLIQKGYNNSDMRKLLHVDEDYDSKQKFRKLVYGIKKRINYKDISDKYEW